MRRLRRPGGQWGDISFERSREDSGDLGERAVKAL